MCKKLISKDARKYHKNTLLPFLIGFLFFIIINPSFNLVDLFSEPDSYVYYYVYSSIVQGYLGLIAFLGALSVFKFQRDEDEKNSWSVRQDMLKKLEDSKISLSKELKLCAMAVLWDVVFALVGITLIPAIKDTLWGPAYLGGSVFLSLWTIKLSYPIIQRVLWLDVK